MFSVKTHHSMTLLSQSSNRVACNNEGNLMRLISQSNIKFSKLTNLRVALYSDWLLVKESIPFCLFFTVFTSKQPARAAYQVGNLPKVINISSIRKFTFFSFSCQG